MGHAQRKCPTQWLNMPFTILWRAPTESGKNGTLCVMQIMVKRDSYHCMCLHITAICEMQVLLQQDSGRVWDAVLFTSSHVMPKQLVHWSHSSGKNLVHPSATCHHSTQQVILFYVTYIWASWNSYLFGDQKKPEQNYVHGN